MDVVTVGTSVVAALLGSTGVAAAIEAVTKRRTRKVDATETLTDTAMEIVSTLKADAAEARRDAAEARQDAIRTHRELLIVREEVDRLTNKLRQLSEAIHDPQAIQNPYLTLNRLRTMVPRGSFNGLDSPDDPHENG